jgi:hypothetical protein
MSTSDPADPPPTAPKAEVTASGAHSVAVNAGAGAQVDVDNATNTTYVAAEVYQPIAVSGGTIGTIIGKQETYLPFQPAPPPSATGSSRFGVAQDGRTWQFENRSNLGMIMEGL